MACGACANAVCDSQTAVTANPAMTIKRFIFPALPSFDCRLWFQNWRTILPIGAGNKTHNDSRP